MQANEACSVSEWARPCACDKVDFVYRTFRSQFLEARDQHKDKELSIGPTSNCKLLDNKFITQLNN